MLGVIVVMIVIRRRYERAGIQMAAMTCAACYRQARVVDFADVLRVDLLDHSHHQACGSFLRLRVVGEVEARLAIRANVFWVDRMASAALGAKRGLPFVHELVHFVAGHGFRQNLEVGRRRCRTVTMLVFMGRWGVCCGLLG